MDALPMLDDLGAVAPANDATIDAAVELVLTAAFQEGRVSVPVGKGKRRRRRWLLGGGAIATAAGVAIAVAVAVPGSTDVRPAARHATAPRSNARPAARAVLTAAMVQHITSATTSALARSGTATVSTTTTSGSIPPDVDTTAVTFSGENLNYVITSSDNPGKPAINRLVDGQFYVYVIGQDLKYHWFHDTSPDAGASLAFPDPRTLVHELTPAAGLENVGTTTAADGSTLEHLQATDPGAISTTVLANFTGSALSTFDVWVDGNGVVQKMEFRGSNSSGASVRPVSSSGTCPAGYTYRKAKRPAGGPAAICLEPVTMTTTTEIDFANIGAPESITAPTGAIDQAMHG